MAAADRVHYIRWLDSCYHADYKGLTDIGDLKEEEEVGWLVKETDDSLTISCEKHTEGEEARLCLVIAKVNIVEWRSFEIPKRARRHRLGR